MKRYKESDVKTLVRRLREEYDGVVRSQREAAEEVMAENRTLRAKIVQLEGERENVTSALLNAEKAGEAIKRESAKEAENGNKELLLLAEQCRLLLARISQKYSDEAEVKDFSAFCTALLDKVGMCEEEEASGFNIDDVLAPKKPLDLGKLCKDLGLMDGE